MMFVFRENLLVMATTTRIATTLANFPPFELSELGVPRAMKTMDLGRDRMTVIMYSQNFIPVQENRGLARSMSTGLVFSHTAVDINKLTWWDDTVSNYQHAPESSLLGNSSNSCPFDSSCDFVLNPRGKEVLEDDASAKLEFLALITVQNNRNSQASGFSQNGPRTRNTKSGSKRVR
jgi:hypothetical protein